MVKRLNSKQKRKVPVKTNPLKGNNAFENAKVKSAADVIEPSDANDVQETLATATGQLSADAEMVLDNAPVTKELPLFRGALDAFTAPNDFKGWAFYQEGLPLRIRIVVDSVVFGEVNADRFRPDLQDLNGGHVGWGLTGDCQLSAEEFLALSDKMQVLVLDEAGEIIGRLRIWDKLLAQLSEQGEV